MGMIFADARNLLDLRRGKTGGRAVTLGRLTTYFHASDLRGLRRIVEGDRESEAWLDAYSWGMPADGFFRELLKFDEIESIDFSDYQGATIIQDLGEPLPQKYHRTFDLAVDGGTLEHVFNFPTAIANLMRLVRVGGHVYSNGPCNNLMGHGFYQFSPELMYRVFAPENGFEIVSVQLVETQFNSVEMTTGHKIYRVVDPDSVGARVRLVNCRPVLMLTLAKCIEACEPFRSKVLQSDYVAKWREGDGGAGGRLGRVKELAKQYLPAGAWAMVRGMASRARDSFRNQRHFKRVD